MKNCEEYRNRIYSPRWNEEYGNNNSKGFNEDDKINDNKNCNEDDKNRKNNFVRVNNVLK